MVSRVVGKKNKAASQQGGISKKTKEPPRSEKPTGKENAAAEKAVSKPTKPPQRNHTTPADRGNVPRTDKAVPITKDTLADNVDETCDYSSPDALPTQLEQKYHKRSAQQSEDSRKEQIAFFRETVRTDLFKKVKFITQERMLDYGHKVSLTVLKALELGKDEVVKERYWNAYSGYVNKALNDKRGNVNNEMKKAFLGTC